MRDKMKNYRKIAFWTISIMLVAGAAVYAQDRNGWLGHMFFTQNNPQIRFNGNLSFQTTSGSTLFTISQSPGVTNVSQMRFYQANLTPLASSARAASEATVFASFSTMEQTFTVTGLSLADTLYVNPLSNTTRCPFVSARVSAANTVALTFANNSNLTCTPAATNYNIFAIRT